MKPDEVCDICNPQITMDGHVHIAMIGFGANLISVCPAAAQTFGELQKFSFFGF